MKIILSVEHPAWVHQFKYVIENLKRQGHEVKVVAIKKDVTIDLLNAYNIPYELISESSGKGILEKGLIFLRTTWEIFKICTESKPDIFIGRASPMMAINSFLFRKPHIVFEDSEPSRFCLYICKLFSDIIITPRCFTKRLGEKQILVNANKELFYLHPEYFYPSPQVLEMLGLKENDKFIVARFVAWDAHHDVGQHGIKDKVGVIKSLEKYGPIFISSEGTLPAELKQYQIAIPPEKIHDVLSFATLFFSDSQTMTTEAALLGTPAIRCNSFVGSNDMGNFIDLEKHGLIFNYPDVEDAITKAQELLSFEDVKAVWRERTNSYLKEKIDITSFMVTLIESYSQKNADKS